MLEYDEIGNPIYYYNDQYYTMSWENGRQLKNANIGGNSTVFYRYSSDGMRKSKYINGVTYYYLYYGSQLIEQSWGDKKLTFVYDDDGKPYSFYYKSGAGDTAYNGMGSKYYYVLNGQGDIVQIRSSTNAFVAEYHYDAWGKLLYISDNSGNKITSTSSVGVINPLRYRGYYYDTETGFYYLQSIYYDPQMKRFINADSQLNAKDGVLGYNMFAYCNNNPVMHSDPSGHSIILACIIVGAVVGALAGGHIAAKVSKAKTGKVNRWAVAGGIVGGGIVGGLIGWGVGAAITAVGAAAAGSTATAAAPVVKQVAEKASTALQTYYPPNDGFSGAVQKITLEAGTLIQRTGDLVGRYIAPAGTPTQILSLPYDKIGQPTTILQVQQSVEVLAGRVAPW